MSGDHIEMLERLARLRESGALSSAEYESEKLKVLASTTAAGSSPGEAVSKRGRSTWVAAGGAAVVVALVGTAIAYTSFVPEVSKSGADKMAETTPAPANLPKVATAPAVTPPAGPRVTAPIIKAGPPDLARYAGKYPDDPVDGVKFLTHPELRRLVRDTVPPAIARRVLDPNATTGPVYVNHESILYWACEPHNCGSHNWTVRIARQTGIPSVCYYRDEEGVASWYHEGRIDVADNCPSDLES